MPRFVFIADSHVGSDGTGFKQQTPYPERLPDLVALLDRWIEREGDIDFVLHGGDMVDAATAENIRRAGELFDFGVPVYLSLGNHDLTTESAVDLWLAEASQFFLGGQVQFSIPCDGWTVEVVPCQWGDHPYYWDGPQIPHFLPEQMAAVSDAAASHPHARRVICTHSPVFGAPVEQTGMSKPFHAPPDSFVPEMTELMRRAGDVRCVLGGHSHINTCMRRDGRAFVTASAFLETPFEFKVMDLSPDGISMRTENLVAETRFPSAPLADRPWVAGRPVDRAFRMDFHQSRGL